MCVIYQPRHSTYPEGASITSVQDQQDHTQTTSHANSSISCTENLLITATPTLITEVKAAVQQVCVQVFPSILGEQQCDPPGGIQSSETTQTGILHMPPGQV